MVRVRDSRAEQQRLENLYDSLMKLTQAQLKGEDRAVEIQRPTRFGIYVGGCRGVISVNLNLRSVISREEEYD